jgi:hypothetical protein
MHVNRSVTERRMPHPGSITQRARVDRRAPPEVGYGWRMATSVTAALLVVAVAQSPQGAAPPTVRAPAQRTADWLAELREPKRRLDTVRELVASGPAALPVLHKALAAAPPDVLPAVLFACSGLSGDVASLREPIRRHLGSKDLGVALAARDAFAAFDGGGRTLVADFHAPAVLAIDGSGDVTELVRSPVIRASVLPDGHLLIAGYHTNRVFEIDAAGNEVWSCGGFDTPHDAERLPDGNTLVADVGNGRVVEVDRDGREVWSFRDRVQPLEVDRLANGNTLIASYRNGVVEVDRAGTVVWQWANHNARDVERLLDGTTLVVCTDEQRVVRVAKNGDRVGEWGFAFRVNAAQLLPNGHVLAGGDGAVVEVAADGREVWRADVKHATSVARCGARRDHGRDSGR